MYLKVLPDAITLHAVVAQDKNEDTSNKVELVFSEISFAQKLIELGITVNGQYLLVRPASIPTSGSRVAVKVPFYVDDDTIVETLSKFGEIKTLPNCLSYGYLDRRFKHVRSFRRELYIKLDRPIPNNLTMRYDVVDATAKIIVESRCFPCGSIRITSVRTAQSAPMIHKTKYSIISLNLIRITLTIYSLMSSLSSTKGNR